MSDIVSPILQWLNANPHMAGLVTFIISAAESVAIIGTIVPGSIMMTALGALAGAGVIPLWYTIFWAIMGAIAGDGISYWLGYHFKNRLPHVWPFNRYPNFLHSGEQFVERYGYMSVFIGRFVGPVRAIVPLVAGMLGMKPIRFVIANVMSAILWAPVYMLPGILLGAASLELPPEIAIHVMLVILLITLFVMLCLWFLYKLALLFHHQTMNLQIRFWHWLKESPHFWSFASLLKHHDSIKNRGQLTTAFYFMVTCIAFLCLALYVKLVTASNIMANQVVHHFFRSIRTPAADNIMLGVTLLGQKEVILPVVFVLFLWLLILRRWRTAYHVLGLTILASGSIFVIKHILKSVRPSGIVASPETFSMPSGHSTLSMTVFLGFAFLIASSYRFERRWPIYLIAILIGVSVGVSRLYLGAHWLTDVMASWLLSAALLMLVVISYQRYKEKPINPASITLIGIAALTISLGTYYHHHRASMLANYALFRDPLQTVSMYQWWQLNNPKLTSEQTRVLGFTSAHLNLQWAGDLTKIRDTLLKEGWTTPPERDLVTIIHRIADIKSAQYISLVSPSYLDEPPALTLTRLANHSRNLLVLRLWSANRLLKDTNSPLWVGVVGIVPRSYSWITAPRFNNSVIMDPTLVFPNKTGLGLWQWKLINLNPSADANSTQTVLLIRENKSAHKKQ